ncbi:MAG: cupin domain-containing protein [Acetivibrionales bacterium]|jgi:mannose-6-phosphate isomerase-like protein (cupin superfamily)
MGKKQLFLRAADIKAVRKTNGRNSKLVASENEMGTEGFAAGFHLMEPGGRSSMHVHENEQESMFFYSGYGECTVGDEEYKIEPETVLLAPKGIPHQIRNTGTEPLKFVWIYCPPLPEHFSQELYHANAKEKLEDEQSK